MFREMRRKRQELSREETAAILHRGTNGVLALAGDEGYPYAVPVSYVYDGTYIYVHGAKAGHKIDAVAREEKASFCVVDQDQIVPEKDTTYFRSAIVFGRMQVVEDEGEKRTAIEKLSEKYSPEHTEERRNKAIGKDWKPLCILRLTIEHMTGKEAIELVRARQAEKA